MTLFYYLPVPHSKQDHQLRMNTSMRACYSNPTSAGRRGSTRTSCLAILVGKCIQTHINNVQVENYLDICLKIVKNQF